MKCMILALIVICPGWTNAFTVSTRQPSKDMKERPPVRAHHSLVYDKSSRMILLTGGSTPLDNGNSFRFYNDRWQFDGTEWRLAGTAGNERSGMSLVYNDRDGKIYSFGGYAEGVSLGDLRVWEGNDWRTLSNDTSMRAAEPGFVYDSGRDRLVAFGGSAAMGVIQQGTWEWSGSNWERKQLDGPAPRQAFAMVYDSRRGRTVLFGGVGTSRDSLYRDTWEYDGKRWEKVSEEGPGPLSSPGVAYDSKRGTMIVFGGLNKGGFNGETWSWDGSNWERLSDSGPSPRAMGYMAYDAVRDRVVLFGGRPGWPNDVNDTWEWNGEKWEER